MGATVGTAEQQPPGERRVQDVLEAALRPGGRLYRNVRWLAATAPGRRPRDGELDVLVVEPETGLLAIEVKDGPVERDPFGRWYAGHRLLDVSPFRQAETSKHVLAERLRDRPDWTRGDLPIGHAVAFPDVDRASIGRVGDLGPDAPLELVIDRADLADERAARAALDRIAAYWSAASAASAALAHARRPDPRRDPSLSDHDLAVIADAVEPAVRLRPLLRGDIEAGERELLAPTRHQLSVLRTIRGERRASIEGGAGSGKTLLAVEKTRQLAADGFRVLFVCFNQPLAQAVAEAPDLQQAIEAGRLTVSTFHELCRRLGEEAGVLEPTRPPRPDEAPLVHDAAWFTETLPRALEQAIPAVGGRWEAVVVDEGQDLEPSWLESLDLLTTTPGESVFYLFHDPAQALYRPDRTADLGLAAFELADDCRSARPIHDFAYRWYRGAAAHDALRDDGREPELVVAEAGEPTVEAVRAVLHRLVHVERVDRERIAVLVGCSLERSAVWHQRRFRGDLTLWNGHVDAEGRSLRLPATDVPPQPRGTIRCETIHRFKGLEADVVVLTEVRADDERLPLLLYIGASRAKHHLVLVVTPDVARWLEA